MIANFQPLWAYADAYIVELTIPKTGAERSGRLYPIGSVARTGAMVVGGSDWPVSSLYPPLSRRRDTLSPVERLVGTDQ